MDGKYKVDLQLRHNVIGANLYLARELNPHLYLDLQGTVGFTEQWIDGKDKMKTLFMVGPGLQWRFGEYFGSKYIDPYARVGVSYMKKNFDMNYTGVEGDLPEEMDWVLENMKNKHGVDKELNTHIIRIRFKHMVERSFWYRTSRRLSTDAP